MGESNAWTLIQREKPGKKAILLAVGWVFLNSESGAVSPLAGAGLRGGRQLLLGVAGGFGNTRAPPWPWELEGGGGKGIRSRYVPAPFLVVPLLRDSKVPAPACAAEIRLTLAVGDFFKDCLDSPQAPSSRIF